jgi:hypothetical protein
VIEHMMLLYCLWTVLKNAWGKGFGFAVYTLLTALPLLVLVPQTHILTAA